MIDIFINVWLSLRREYKEYRNLKMLWINMQQIIKQILVILILCIGSCQAQTPHKVVLSWQLPPEFTGFSIYRSTDNKNYTVITTVKGPVKQYTDVNVQARTTYYYKAKTFCKVCKPNISAYSNIVHVTVP